MITAIRLLLSSRKFVMALLGVAAMVGARFGFAWSAETMAVIVLPFLAVIFGISYEDGQAKAAGAGTTTTTTPIGSAVVTTIEPDPTGKP